jgi:tetratricopeptide (TPR) repeat protein
VTSLLLAVVLAASPGGDELYRKRDFAGAEKAFRAVLARNPRNLDARVALARTLVQLERVPEAIAEIGTTLKLHAGNPEAEFQAGRILQGLAASRFARLARTAPDSAGLRELLGRQYEAQNNLPRALAEYRAALAREPQRNGLHFLAGNVLWKMSEPQAALAELEAELRSNPNHALARWRAGQILLTQGAADPALRHLEAAVAANPQLLEARRDLARALRQAGRHAEALKHFQIIAGARPHDDQVHAQLASVYRALGDEAAARRELQIHREILDRKRAAARKSFEEQAR